MVFSMPCRGRVRMARGVDMNSLMAARHIDDDTIPMRASLSHGSQHVATCECGDRHQNQHCPKTLEHQPLKPCLHERSRQASGDVVLTG